MQQKKVRRNNKIREQERRKKQGIEFRPPATTCKTSNSPLCNTTSF